MAFELKDNSGSLFKNDKKEKDTHPNATGKCLIDGKLYYISSWTKEGNKGRFQSLSFKPVEQETKPNPNNRTRPKGNEYMDDENGPPF